ncbi:MAG: acetyl-CoA carboxylase biotin carboxylase subunit [Pseudomonadota bacterium]
MFDRILIANRGEIACRIINTARRMGIATVAVYSDADRDALHVALADSAVHIGEAPASRSYLVGERILAAARATGAQAIHPGYGFLSENAAFAAACEAAGIVFIGPPASAIEAMGSKAQAKAIMADAGVPLIPGYHEEDQNPETLRSAADAMGYPVLLKATAGGGGKGMRAVHGAAEFDEALASATREAKASFGDERMLIEKLLQGPRHVEVQVFCDSHGNAVYLADRDCSVQRRHQKVMEEAPAPGLAAELRKAMGEAAVDAARAIHYRGAGTVEFLLGHDGAFYFMEMNTRLQVEHPVTEMVTGQDLVEWQLRVAAGEPLPLAQEEIRVDGHAIEARIYAEDPERDFLPASGRLQYLRTPGETPELRIDSGVREGSEISPHYDPMIAKLICSGETREDARRRTAAALRDYRVAGIANNLEFLYNLVCSEEFRHATLDTGFIERNAAILFRESSRVKARDLGAAALLLKSLRGKSAAASLREPYSPWASADGWRLNAGASQRFELECHGDVQSLELRESEGGSVLAFGDSDFGLRGDVHGDKLHIEIEGHRYAATFSEHDEGFTIFWMDGAFSFREQRYEVMDDGAAAGSADFEAPMHGTVVALLVEPGTAVTAGDPVIVIEAMKMEQTLRAPVAGQVEGFNVAPGDLVDRGQALVDFSADTAR